MTDINVGFGKVLRVRWLRASHERKHIWGPKVVTLSALQLRHTKALDLLERRRELRVLGAETDLIDANIKALGYVFQDEPDDNGDGRYSYWRKP